MKWLLILILSTLIGCAGSEVEEESGTGFKPKEQIYSNYSFDSIWRAVQISLSHYPIKVNNMEAGVLETDTVSGTTGWRPAHRETKINSGIRYTIKVNVIRGRVKNKPVTKVTVYKAVREQKDFFSQASERASDGLEEDTILYRINRELKIERAIERANNNQ